jgi:hypothetical protein
MFGTAGSKNITYRDCVQIARSYVEDAAYCHEHGHEDAEKYCDRRIDAIITALPILFCVKYDDVVLDVYRDFVPMTD